MIHRKQASNQKSYDNEELCEAMNDALSNKWGKTRGLDVVSVAKRLGHLPSTATNYYLDQIPEEDKKFIIDNYMDMTDKEIGEIIGKSEHAVNGIRFRMGLKKPKKQSYNDLQEYIRRNNA